MTTLTTAEIYQRAYTKKMRDLDRLRQLWEQRQSREKNHEMNQEFLSQATVGDVRSMMQESEASNPSNHAPMAADYANAVLLRYRWRAILNDGLRLGVNTDDDDITPDIVNRAGMYRDEEMNNLRDVTYEFHDRHTEALNEFYKVYCPNRTKRESFFDYIEETRTGRLTRLARTEIYVAARFNLRRVMNKKNLGKKSMVRLFRKLMRGMSERNRHLWIIHLDRTLYCAYNRRLRIQSVKKAWKGVKGYEDYRDFFAPV